MMSLRDRDAIRELFALARAQRDLAALSPWPGHLMRSTLERHGAARVQLTRSGRASGFREHMRALRARCPGRLPAPGIDLARRAMTAWRLARYVPEPGCICSRWPAWRLCRFCDSPEVA